MALTRRILHEDLEQRVKDVNHQKPRLKQVSKNARQGRQRMALGDIPVNQVSKFELNQKCKKESNGEIKVCKEKSILSENSQRVVETFGKPKAMSICETDESKMTHGSLGVMHMESSSIIPKENHAPVFVDIDIESYNDPYQCSEYAPDIFNYLKALEKKLRVVDYMHKQTDINERMRSILVDWLIQVHSRFGLLQETLYLTVYIIDRLLECHVVSRSKLQLVGISAMLLASKYEETYAPEIGDFVYISDNSYSKGQIKKMEQLILKTINFDLSNPLCLHFLRRYSKAAQADAKQHTLAKYFMELTLVDYKMARLLPSQIAAASLLLAGQILKNLKWTKSVEYYSSFTEEDLKPMVESLKALIIRAESSKLQAVRTKYATSKQMRVSTLIAVKGETISCVRKDDL